MTETVDAGLLGEMIIPTLRHAWSDLLVRPRADTTAAQPSNQVASSGHVIPCGATVYVCAVECQEIRRQSRLAPLDNILTTTSSFIFLG